MPTDQSTAQTQNNVSQQNKSDDINLSINLEPSTTEDTFAKPEITLDISDDRLAKEDKIVEDNLKQEPAKTTETVIEEAVPVEQVIEKKVEEVVNQEEKKETGKISNLFVEIEPEPAKSEPVKPEPVTQESQITETPVIEATVIDPAVAENHTIESPIIEHVEQKVETPVVENPVVETPKKAGINLDDILGSSPTVTPVTPIVSNIPMINPITNEVINNQTVLPVFNSNPATNNTNNTIPSYNVPISNIQNTIAFETKKVSSKKLLINVVLGIVIFVVLGFVFKTMYPIQYNNLLGINKIENSIDNNINNDNIIPQPTVDNTLTGENTTQTLGQNVSTGLAVDTTVDTHRSAQDQSGFDPFADINEATEETVDIEATKIKLQGYIDTGKKVWVIAKKTNDKELLKNSLYLWKKAETFMNRIATGEEITNDEITQQVQKLEESLKNLNKVDAETVSGETNIQQESAIPTPADFFSNQEETGGSETGVQTFSQNVSTGQDISTGEMIESGDMIQ